MRRTISTAVTLAVLFYLQVSCSGDRFGPRDDRVWFFIEPVQCMGNPWEYAWLEENNYDYELWREMTEQEKLEVFEEYYEDQGVQIYSIKYTWPYEATCDGCFCPNGDRIHCLIHENDIDQMVVWGFVEE